MPLLTYLTTLNPTKWVFFDKVDTTARKNMLCSLHRTRFGWFIFSWFIFISTSYTQCFVYIFKFTPISKFPGVTYSYSVQANLSTWSYSNHQNFPRSNYIYTMFNFYTVFFFPVSNICFLATILTNCCQCPTSIHPLNFRK